MCRVDREANTRRQMDVPKHSVIEIVRVVEMLRPDSLMTLRSHLPHSLDIISSAASHLFLSVFVHRNVNRMERDVPVMMEKIDPRRCSMFGYNDVETRWERIHLGIVKPQG